jgi:hypothetical protein
MEQVIRSQTLSQVIRDIRVIRGSSLQAANQ